MSNNTELISSQVQPVNSGPNELQWTDALGRPKPRGTIERILCLKVDHIGDLLVADLGMRLLRRFFPSSQITLICGEWNVALARLLELADVVIGVSLFSPRGMDQHDGEHAARARSAGMSRLLEIASVQGEFDLAIDLRIDEDTRDLLKLFKARIYAGSGDLAKYPFLDVSVPMARTHLNGGSAAIRLSAHDFTDFSGFKVGPLGLGFASESTSKRITLAIKGARSPAQCGTNPQDKRALGIGLQSASLVVVDADNSCRVIREYVFRTGSPDCMFLGEGWSGSEPWGTWTICDEAILNLTLPTTDLSLTHRLVLHFQAHVNPQNRSVTVTAADAAGGASVAVLCEFPETTFVSSLSLSPATLRGYARSRAINLRAGEHRLMANVLAIEEVTSCLRISIQGSRPVRTIAAAEVIHEPTGPARVSAQFDFTHRDADESLHILLESTAGYTPAGLHLQSIVSSLSYSAPAGIPAGHMEKLIARLVTAVALEFSPFFMEFSQASEKNLNRYPEGSLDTAVMCRLLSEKKSRFTLVGLSIGATKETKRWPFSYMLELCELMLARNDIHLVLFGGPGDIDETARLERSLKHPERVTNLSGKTSLTDFGAIVSNVDLYLGYDTGTTHYAGRVGLRTIGIFAAVHSPREWGPVGRRASWITHYTGCSPCHLAKLSECRFGHACMVDLLPAECWKIISRELVDVRTLR